MKSEFREVIFVFLKTDRLIIRDLETADGMIFSGMASDGSLDDIGFDTECGSWMDEWMAEARKLAADDDPTVDYLAYTVELKDTHEVIGSVGCSYYRDMDKIGIVYFIGTEYRNHGYAAEAAKAYVRYFLLQYKQDEIIATIREDNVSSWKTIEKAGFRLTEEKPYKDIGGETEQMYRFYSKHNACCPVQGHRAGLIGELG